MLTSSKKAKGRLLCKLAKDIIVNTLALSDKDLEVTSSGAPGIDIKLSPAARKVFPYAIECKNQEAISIWKCWEQCCDNARKETLTPLLIFKRNKSDVLVTLTLTDFMDLFYEKAKKA